MTSRYKSPRRPGFREKITQITPITPIEVIPNNFSKSIGMLDIVMHGGINVDATDIRNIQFDILNLNEIINDTDLSYRSNTITNCSNFMDTYTSYWINLWDTHFNTFCRDSISLLYNTGNSMEFRDAPYRDIIEPYRNSILTENKKTFKQSLHAVKRFQKNQLQAYEHATQIINKHYSAVDDLSTVYDMNNPEASIILSFSCKNIHDEFSVYNFDILQYKDNNVLNNKYKDHYEKQGKPPIYNGSLLSLLYFFKNKLTHFPVIDIEQLKYTKIFREYDEIDKIKMRPFVIFVKYLKSVFVRPLRDLNPESSLYLERRNNVVITTKIILDFLSIFHFSNIFIYDNSCSNFNNKIATPKNELIYSRILEEKIDSLPSIIARGGKTRKYRKYKKYKKTNKKYKTNKK